MRVRQFVDEGLGNSGHLVISDSHSVAALIDPLRDVDCYVDAARSDGGAYHPRTRDTYPQRFCER